MRIHRHVPLFSATRAANDAFPAGAESGSDAFHAWGFSHEVSTGVRSPYSYGNGSRMAVLSQLSVPADVLLDEVLPHVPDTIVGRAWAACVRQCVGLTQSDVVRPFDHIEYTTTEEHDALDAIENYARAVEDTTPLLGDVADTISRMTLVGSHRRYVPLEEVARERSRLTDDGLLLGTFDENHCSDHDDYCYHLNNATLIAWKHLEALMPGIEATVRRLLAVLDADMPEVAESDGGAARTRMFTADRTAAEPAPI